MAATPLEAGLRILALRDHAEAELRRKLKAKGFPAAELEPALARLRELGYLDDLRFARHFAESALRNGRYVGGRLKQELQRRGVAPALIVQVLSELSQEFSEPETLSAVMQRRFAGFDPQAASDKEKRRVVGYLQRKGFTLSAIFHQLKLNSTF